MLISIRYMAFSFGVVMMVSTGQLLQRLRLLPSSAECAPPSAPPCLRSLCAAEYGLDRRLAAPCRKLPPLHCRHHLRPTASCRCSYFCCSFCWGKAGWQCAAAVGGTPPTPCYLAKWGHAADRKANRCGGGPPRGLWVLIAYAQGGSLQGF